MSGRPRTEVPELRLDPVERESTPALIARTLRAAMARGDLPPGTQLGEAALATRLGVSRGPLREAMQRLTQEGLLVSYRNRGIFVPELTPAAVEDMYVLRGALEGAAVRRILAGGDPTAAAADLEAACDVMAGLADEPDGHAMADADIAFHRRLVEAAHSGRLSRVHESVLVETAMCLRAMRGSYQRAEERVAEHRAIARRIGDRDLPGALTALDEHMRDGLARLLDTDRAPGRAAG